MEAFSAIGLACNLLQFIDFGCKLFTATHEIYTSATGLKSDAEMIRVLTADLERFSTKFAQSLARKATTDDEIRLIALLVKCQQAADELLRVLAKLAPKGGSSSWKSFKTALTAVWKQEQIERMHSQLNSLRMELLLRLQAMARPDGSTAQQISQLREENAQMQAKFDLAIKTLQADVNELLKHMQRNAQGVPVESHHSLPQSGPQSGETLFSHRLADLTERGNYLTKAVGLLKSLYFQGVDFRFSKVAVAHSNTFEWAYRTSFAEWLKSDKSLFWVSGKPGSGKSTLMKYLHNNPNTARCLKQWAGRRELMTGNHFFWVNGNDMQRSQEGLLRAILLDLVRRWPEAVDKIIRSGYWTPEQDTDASFWMPDSLSAILELVVRDVDSNRCFCFFIDGLDEYEGDLEDLVAFIGKIKRLQNVKLCIASRPWNIFESAFGQEIQNKLYVQDLTRGDISLYVSDILRGHSHFQKSVGEGVNIEVLVNEVVEKAQGVFLWVYLVVKSLTEGFRNADRIIDLRRRLQSFPADLNHFFGYILDSLDPIYRAQTARGFQAVMAAPRRLSILQFWYLDQEEEDPDYAINRRIPHISEIPALRLQDHERAANMATRVNGRFKGLLEVTNERSGRYYLADDKQSETSNELKVDFLHRTVKDFLATRDCFATIREWTPESFYVDESLCKAYIADLKDCCARKEVFMNREHFTDLVKDYLRASQAHEAKTGKGLEPLFEELQKVVNTPSPGSGQETLWELLDIGPFMNFVQKQRTTTSNAAAVGIKLPQKQLNLTTAMSERNNSYPSIQQTIVGKDVFQSTAPTPVLAPTSRTGTISRKTGILRVPTIRGRKFFRKNT